MTHPLPDEIECMWEIREVKDQTIRDAGYPFMIIRIGSDGCEHVDPDNYCRTIEETEVKINLIAQEYQRKGHLLGIA